MRAEALYSFWAVAVASVILLDWWAMGRGSSYLNAHVAITTD